MMNLSSNITLSCEIPQTFVTFEDFSQCYKYFSSKAVAATILEIGLSAGTVFCNLLVVICMVFGSKKKTCFDEILFGYCIVDGVTGLIDMPLFHCNDIFGYWPFGKTLAMFWASYDNNINFNTSVHMFYACYARYRSIKNPKGYNRELFLKRPRIVMVLIWIVCMITWLSITFGIGTVDYDIQVNYYPYYVRSFINFFTWFIPLTSIMSISIVILYELRKKRLRSKKYSSSKKPVVSVTRSSAAETKAISGGLIMQIKTKISNYFVLTPEKRFFFIMFSYWIQWTPPCILTLISGFFSVDPTVSNSIYWLTYTVCMTDPICVLTLNPNITFPKIGERQSVYKRNK